jgi:hypothetical protein
MFAHYQPGSIAMRNLSSDDVNGICSVYAPNGTRSTNTGAVTEGVCDPTPRHGFSTVCGEPQKKGCIPSSIGARDPSSGAAFGTLAVLGLALARRARVRERANARAQRSAP